MQDSAGNLGVDAVDARDRWVAISLWDKPPLQPALSGLAIEYRVLQVYSRDRGRREALFVVDAGHGTQDLGFRSSAAILFDCLPSNDQPLQIRDMDGSPTMASLLITDSLGRVYPMQAKRALPDLWFERQIYRAHGETVRLPAGTYSIEYGRGPEYLRQQMTVSVGESGTAKPISLALKRWVDTQKFGYYPGDSHIHASGCSHYESPAEGVTPEVMLRQVQGEGLSVGDVLTRGPGYYYQRQFFSGHVRNLTFPGEQISGTTLLRYDVEASGFPSSHGGHLVLLRLADQDYPGTSKLDEWPSWNLPILRWGKSQGAVVGYAHAGAGLVVDSTELPNYLTPRFDSGGANEYLVDVTHDNVVDFISGCDLWPFAELNVWYHTLNCGFWTAFAGETDFPCITNDHVGGGRSYVKVSAEPHGDEGYDDWVQGLKAGRSYFGDGRSHLFNFAVESGGKTAVANELALGGPVPVHVSADVCGWLEPEVSEGTEKIRTASKYGGPFWHLERARVGRTRKVPVELIVNGIAVQRSEIEADGAVHRIHFEANVQQSSWVAMRIYPSSHTNPVFLTVDGAPVRASRQSAKWCREGVDACWRTESPRIRPGELDEARAAFEHARNIYDRIASQSVG